MTASSRPRHPVTGRRFWLRARSPRELAAYLHRIESLRTELRLGLTTPADVERALRRLRFGVVTFGRAATSYLERPIAPNTRRRIKSALGGHYASLLPVPLEGIDGACLSAWLESLTRQGLRTSSIGTLWRGVRAVVRHAAERGWIAAAPWGAWRPRIRGLEARAPREAARSVDELGALLIAARALDARALAGPRPRLPAIEAKIACAALLGLRQGELGGLRWTDVRTDPPRIRVARQYDGAPIKTRRSEELETIDELIAILDRHAAGLIALRLYDPAGPIFPAPGLSAPDRPRAYRRGDVLSTLNLRAAVRAANLPNVEAWSAHSLRDTFVTLEAAATRGDLRSLMDRSRHVSLASLARYLRAHSRDPAPPAIRSLAAPSDDGAGPPRLGSR